MSDRKERPFAYRVQALLVVGLVLSFVLIMQTVSMVLYRIGIMVLIGSTLVQIPFGNIPPEADRRRTFRMFAWMVLILIAVFGIGILIAPMLVNMGR
ncbi:MAG: hypothetical protein MI724_17960 [Spirochaetales bacterium]|nr:hypothetical protein [Spirochaetales bacterium]